MLVRIHLTWLEKKRKQYHSKFNALTMLIKDLPNMVSKRNQTSYIKGNHGREGPV